MCLERSAVSHTTTHSAHLSVLRAGAVPRGPPLKLRHHCYEAARTGCSFPMSWKLCCGGTRCWCPDLLGSGSLCLLRKPGRFKHGQERRRRIKKGRKAIGVQVQSWAMGEGPCSFLMWAPRFKTHSSTAQGLHPNLSQTIQNRVWKRI